MHSTSINGRYGLDTTTSIRDGLRQLGYLDLFPPGAEGVSCDICGVLTDSCIDQVYFRNGLEFLRQQQRPCIQLSILSPCVYILYAAIIISSMLQWLKKLPQWLHILERLAWWEVVQEIWHNFIICSNMLAICQIKNHVIRIKTHPLINQTK